MSQRPGFPTTLAAKLTGVTPKTLENWAQRGFLKPSILDKPGHAGTRIYSFRDLVVIRVVDDMRRKGIDIRHLRRVVEFLRQRLAGADVVASTVLVTDGQMLEELAAVDDPRMTTLLAEQSLFVVPFGRLVAKVQADALNMLAAA
jgi:DNA-binding transcriptional MerR regulator